MTAKYLKEYLKSVPDDYPLEVMVKQNIYEVDEIDHTCNTLTFGAGKEIQWNPPTKKST